MTETMSDDDLIVLSDSDVSHKSGKPIDNDDNFNLKDKEESDFSDSDFPVIRFSEINGEPTSSKRTEEKDVDSSDTSEHNFNNKNDSSQKISKGSKAKNSPVLDSNFEKINLKDKNKIDEDNQDFSEDDVAINNLETIDFQEKEWSYSDFPDINYDDDEYYSSNLNNEKKSDNDSDYESQCIYQPILKKNQKASTIQSDKDKKTAEKKVTKRKKKAVSDQPDDVDNNKKNNVQPTKKRGKKKTPNDYIKLMEVVIDKEIETLDFFNTFTKAAEENEINYSVQSQKIPKSISWKRKIEEIDYELGFGPNEKTVNENQVIVIWDCEETVNHVANDTFVTAIKSIKALAPNKKLTLVNYKLENYFRYIKNSKNLTSQKNSDNETEKKKSKSGKGFSSFPKISKDEFDRCTVKIQLFHDINSRVIENEGEMALFIEQFTKSIACLPLKLEEKEKLSNIDWCISCDNKDTVKIDKDGNGLIRLWQQQLRQFPLASLETSEAIASVYKTPSQLMAAYANCTQSEGEMLLKDIPIRRHAGVLTSTKRIGPELSKKVFIMFTSEDGNVFLNG